MSERPLLVPGVDPADSGVLSPITEILGALRNTATPARPARAAKRAQILDAAIELFAAHGFAAVGMRQLAARVGLSAPGLYAHFDSKESIVAAAMKQALGRFLEAVLLPADANDDQGRFDGLIRRHVCFQLENLPLTKANDQLLASDSLPRFLPAPDHDILLAAQRAYYDLLHELIQAEAPSASTEQVRLAAFAILAMCDRVTSWYRPDGTLTVDQVAEQYSRLARRLVASLEGTA